VSVLISDKDKEYLKEEFKKSLKGEVTLAVFTQEMECQFCKENRELAEDIAETSDKIKVMVYDFVKDTEKVKELVIDKVPAIAVLGNKDYGIRFYGIPHGYELKPLIEDIINVSRGATNLSEETKEKLRKVNKPVHIQVFVTLTCPYCSIATSLAHKFAFENDYIKSDIVEISEFPHLAQKYSVMGVPKIVINETIEFLGVLPEDHFVEHVLLAMKQSPIYV